jgi:hypothetical protein
MHRARQLWRHVTRWDCCTLQQVVVEQAMVESIHYTTVARILAAADLQSHRNRYWKTAPIDEEFVTRAAQVPGCYEHVRWLQKRGEVVICVDEKPNIQALARFVSQEKRGTTTIKQKVIVLVVVLRVLRVLRVLCMCNFFYHKDFFVNRSTDMGC